MALIIKTAIVKAKAALLMGYVRKIWVIPPYVGLVIIGIGLVSQKSETDQDQDAFMMYTREENEYQIKNVEYNLCQELSNRRDELRQKEFLFIELVKELDGPEDAINALERSLEENFPAIDPLKDCPPRPPLPTVPEELRD